MGSKITKVRKSILLAHLSGPPRYKFLQSMDSGTDSWGEAMFSRKARSLVLILVGMLMSPSAHAQGRITTPMEQFDFNLGDDYQLANYTQLEAYWKKLAAESDRITLEVIGYTTEGRPIHMAIITAPDNHENLGRYKEISRRLALAEGVDEEEARELSAEGRAVVWIDGGLHATETLGAQQLMEWVYQMASRTDDETMRFLRDTILLATLVNPDGLELVANWYMNEPDPEKRSLSGIPRLSPKYTGHDNNRDFYMSSQPETEAINNVLYREWFPQIVYNHHQSGPRGTVLFAPPFRDPFNYNYDPLIVTSLDLVAGAMHSRFLAEGKPGATMRSGATYSTWWNGGLRTSPYFHNMIGLLTETIGSPTPMEIPFVVDKQVPRGDYPAPIEPQVWHLSQSIEYSITANRAVLDIASRYRDTLLFNIWRMGMNSIERGSRDNWTRTPKRVTAVAEAIRLEEQNSANGDPQDLRHHEMLQDPDLRDPRGYIIPSDQPDFLTATKFINALIKSGVRVHRASANFEVNGTDYSVGSYIVRTAQAFRPHILDMFEPQDHPNDFAYPGAPPTPPYDTTGWTLAFQMGIESDRILEGFEGPFEEIEGMVVPPSGRVTGLRDGEGFFLSHDVNDAFIAVNRLVGVDEDVYWLREPVSDNGKTYPAGTMYVRRGANTTDRLEDLSADLGLTFEATANEPVGDALMLDAVRIGLWDRYGGSEPSGWTRFVLENFEFPFEVVYPQILDEGNLDSEFDVLIFVDDGIPARDQDNPQTDPRVDNNISEEYASQEGQVSIARTVPKLREFLEAGGTILSIGGSTVLAEHIGLPISNALTEKLPDGTERDLPREKFYVPGSLLRAQVDNTHPLGFGLGSEVDVVFNSSLTFQLDPDAVKRGVEPVAWYVDRPLRSGWAWGESYLEDGVAVVDASVGQGKLFLFGPEVAFRAQSHGTFKFLFNGIYYGSAQPVTLGER